LDEQVEIRPTKEYYQLPKVVTENGGIAQENINLENASLRNYLTLAAVLGLTLTSIPAVVAKPGLPSENKENIFMPMIITSPTFKQDGDIPERHTCDGLNISPMLEWSDVPSGTKSVALIVDDPDAPDPDAPRMTWVHWVVYNIPPDAKSLPETFTAEGSYSGIMEGLNDWNRTGYQGPCPPIGKHRYYFKLYALDIVLPDLKSPVKAALEKAMKGHILARSELLGRYQRK
jgi:Raf kinase inhibitor-like YbhB/YbcL family protein